MGKVVDLKGRRAELGLQARKGSQRHYDYGERQLVLVLFH